MTERGRTERATREEEEARGKEAAEKQRGGGGQEREAERTETEKEERQERGRDEWQGRSGERRNRRRRRQGHSEEERRATRSARGARCSGGDNETHKRGQLREDFSSTRGDDREEQYMRRRRENEGMRQTRSHVKPKERRGRERSVQSRCEQNT